MVLVSLGTPMEFIAAISNRLDPSTERFTSAVQLVLLFTGTTNSPLIKIAVPASFVPAKVCVGALVGVVTGSTTGFDGVSEVRSMEMVFATLKFPALSFAKILKLLNPCSGKATGACPWFVGSAGSPPKPFNQIALPGSFG